MNRGRKAVVSCTAILFLLVAVWYLFIRHQGEDSVMEQEDAVPPGTLVGITYNYTGGSMVARADFSITLSPEAILETRYWSTLDPGTAKDEEWDHPFTKENVPITTEQWLDVEQIILELYPLMKPMPENRLTTPERWIQAILLPWVEVRDGVSSISLILTWSTEDGTQSIRYYMPDDHRIHTLITLLEELADPIGREIPRYAPPNQNQKIKR